MFHNQLLLGKRGHLIQSFKVILNLFHMSCVSCCSFMFFDWSGLWNKNHTCLRNIMISHHCKNGKMCPFYKNILSIDDWESIDCLENASGKIKLHDLRLLAVPSTFWGQFQWCIITTTALRRTHECCSVHGHLVEYITIVFAKLQIQYKVCYQDGNAICHRS